MSKGQENNDDTSIFDDKTIFPDLPNGSLTIYRQRASFNYKKLALILEPEDSHRLKHKIWTFMEDHPEFARNNSAQTLDELRQLAVRRHNLIHAQKFWTSLDFIQNPHLDLIYYQALTAYGDFYAKAALGVAVFTFVLRALGTERLQKYVDACERMEIFGSFGLTEVAHGTNTMGMRTTATYDPISSEFIIHTPDFQAAKCWIGNLGKTCTHCIVFAQLYTADGKYHGLNAFLVPIRCPKTLEPFPGILVGDLGEKIGLNGLDNGFAMFNQVRIPRENLLSRFGDITSDGKYLTKIQDYRKRMAVTFGTLSGGRANICGTSSVYLIQAVTIAVRYSASRRQFGPENSSEENSVLEYQSHQYRVLPHLATAIAFKVFSQWLSLSMNKSLIKQMMGEPNSNAAAVELHALSSSAKPYVTWTTQQGIQDCREACGGHGYLKIARLGELRNNNDGSITYEGENNVLIQQTSNWLLSVRKSGYQSFGKVSPLGSALFLKDFNHVINRRSNYTSSDEALRPENIQIALDWLCAWLLEQTGQRFDSRTVFNVFYEHVLNLGNSTETANERAVLLRVLSLYGGNILMGHSGILCEGGFVASPATLSLYKLGVLEILAKLKDDAIALVDAIAHTDFIIDSPLGMSDGEVYRHLQSKLFQSPGVFERPQWWEDMIHWQSYVKAKL
ncbi:hypothetical protein HA402_002926 [Bradysia odoriphaga]|nr:hypothetical protein HA402_002926 [Bradysia odoriphaga]